MNNLHSENWIKTRDAIRKCHLSTLQEELVDVFEWKQAFDLLMGVIKEERRYSSNFALELSDLTKDSGFEYDMKDILEEYFDELEKKDSWELVVESCDQMLEEFEWLKDTPSQYFFRKGNALQHTGKLKEAEEFGAQWLEQYPNDYYAAASNVFLLLSLGKKEKALEITEHCLKQELICDKATDTFFMAATRLYELTEDGDAKERVAKKIAEYEALVAKMK